MAGKKVRFRAKDETIRELIALMRAHQIARITSGFKVDVMNNTFMYPYILSVNVNQVRCYIRF